MWAIDAAFKWQPAFRQGFIDQIKSAAAGQPSWLGGWFSFWVQLFSHNQSLFAWSVTIIELLIAIALIFGIARKSTYLAAAVFSLFIWAIPEGFGGPCNATSTDIGTGIIYTVVFFALYGLDRLAMKSTYLLDGKLAKHIAWWSIIANP